MMQCVPMIKNYGKQEEYIQSLKTALAKLEQREMTFKEYQEKKQQLKKLEKEM
jgi:cell shape-determining protein MreC